MIRISERLLCDSLTEKDNVISWRFYNFNYKTKSDECKDDQSIYSGNSGVLFFFLELYYATGDAKYLKIVERGADTIISKMEGQTIENYAFYTGWIGVAYTLLKIDDVAKTDKYCNATLFIAKQCGAALENESYENYDLLSGFAGTLLGLLHIYDHTGEKWLLPLIDKFLERIIKSFTYCQEEGISWPKKQLAKKNLCGFSHGAGGIGFVLIEVGRYFENDNLVALGMGAFNYENANFDPELGNWPDFRVNYDNAMIEHDKVAFSSGGKIIGDR